MSYDVALVALGDAIIVHTATCPLARTAASLGFPVATLFECAELPEGLERHECIEEADE